MSPKPLEIDQHPYIVLLQEKEGQGRGAVQNPKTLCGIGRDVFGNNRFIHCEFKWYGFRKLYSIFNYLMPCSYCSSIPTILQSEKCCLMKCSVEWRNSMAARGREPLGSWRYVAEIIITIIIIWVVVRKGHCLRFYVICRFSTFSTKLPFSHYRNI